jgi:hypothetical protein
MSGGRISVEPARRRGNAARVYAVVATVRIENVQAARDALPSARLNLVPRAPGFVNAYWLAPVDGIGMSVIVFDSREHADQAATYPLPPLPGITPLTLEVREVYASA